MLAPALAEEISALHPRQRDAVLHDGGLVILAGPGAGKTRTLVAKVGYLLATTSEHRSVAAITYTDAAAREVGERLRRLGLTGGRRLASCTVHAFCLKHILVPYSAVAGHPLPTGFQVLDAAGSDRLWADALAEANVHLSTPVRRELPIVTRIRRRVAAGEDVSDYTPQHRRAVTIYEKRLREDGLLDFDEMTHRALYVLRDSEPARELLVSRFPYLVVDEYQDLGPVLHALVTTLIGAGMTVTAVGDPDQTMFEFQGADPRYLHELAPLVGCEPVRLTLNFRSGSALVAAGRAALGADRGYTHDPDREDPGVIEVSPVNGDLDTHAARTVAVVTELLGRGVPAEEIAVLYPGQTDLHELVADALTDAQISFDNERARRVPAGRLAEWISACAARRLSGPLPGHDAAAGAAPLGRRTVGGARTPATLRELAATLHRLRMEAGLALPEDSPRSLARRLLSVVDAAERENPENDAATFLAALDQLVDLPQLAAASHDRRDQSVPAKLSEALNAELSMAELAGGRAPGRIVMTTYHSAKGREFSAVVLPGLVEGLIPFYFRNQTLTQRDFEVARRQFYVAVTRAIDAVVLIPGTRFTAWGQTRVSGWSTFITDIEQVINEASP